MMSNEIQSFPEILLQDEEILVLRKPAGWFVHPPENPIHRRGLRRRTCVQWLQDFHSIKASPAHRIDFATEGLLLCGKTKHSLVDLNSQFKNHEVTKEYMAVVRGWLQEKEALIDLPLELDSTGDLVDCQTEYQVMAEMEFSVQLSKRFTSSRISLIRVSPKTGRWHQIRRHMNRISHPLIGDSEHGDSRYNRYFREELQLGGLCLWAKELHLRHPTTGDRLNLADSMSPKWSQIYELFNFLI